MTGSYASFKGKLKAGDMVKLAPAAFNPDGGTYVVTKVEPDRFWVSDSLWFSWSDNHQLELLSPSPRVVTVEEMDNDMSKPSRITTTHYTYLAAETANPNNETRYYQLHDTAMLPCEGRVPLENLPAPAEKEEEWWDSLEFMEYDEDHGWFHDSDGVKKIVAEAKRMGAEEAWKNMHSVLDTIETGRDVRWPDNVPWNEEGDGWDALKIDMRMAIDAKLESLNKPAGAGEK